MQLCGNRPKLHLNVNKLSDIYIFTESESKDRNWDSTSLPLLQVLKVGQVEAYQIGEKRYLSGACHISKQCLYATITTLIKK